MSGRPYRLPETAAEGSRIDRSRVVTFSFDGTKMSGFAGDTVASAVLATGRKVFGRSFKYHRPRGLIGLGSEEMNALIGVGEGGRKEPNLRATQVELYDGLVATSQNRWPSLDFDIGIINNKMSRFLPGGFYYKTFMWPRSFWESVYEPFIRNAAGLGNAAHEQDPDTYEQMHVHVDVLVVGGGVSGIAAAQAAAATGKRVILADENIMLGGVSDISHGEIDGKSQRNWIAERQAEFAKSGNVHVLTRTTVVGHYHHNYVLAAERVADHDPELIAQGAPRHRLWKIRASQIIVASGALERPIAFANNDRPGIMMASAARAMVERYATSPGMNGVIFTNNDDGYLSAIRLQQAGVGISSIIDVRDQANSALPAAARAAGIKVQTGAAIAGVETRSGGKEITGVKVAPYAAGRGRVINETMVECDFVAVSGGYNPVVHLWCHNGGKLKFDDTIQSFRPDKHTDPIMVVGAANGTYDLKGCLDEGYEAGESAVKALGAKPAVKLKKPSVKANSQGEIQPIWFAPATGKYNEGNKHFIDFQNDVTAADLELAQREGYESVEHTKRYTTLGMATDQGKTSNINGLGVISDATGKRIPEIGTTTFRPPYTPYSFGAIAGTKTGELFLPVRRTAIYDWHIANEAIWEPVGQWRRAYCYPRGGENKHEAINREILSVRNHVGMLDASTLGKIEIKGPDAAKFLDLVYTNVFSTLKVGKARYGLMMNEMGFLMDDGVTVRLGEDHFLMHTTSGGADNIVAWLEEWLQTEWTTLKVFVTAVTEQWSQFAVAGPNARKVLAELDSDIDLSPEAFEFMSYREGTLGGFPVRIFRISFSGELSYEIATPSGYGRGLWDALMEAGKTHSIAAYGTEALHVLRAEKGFIVIGDETDGTVTPYDVNMGWAVSKKKADFIGKRSLSQSYLAADGRKQLVGLLTDNPSDVLPDGAYAVAEIKPSPPMKMIGQVTSSYYSPTLDRSIAMALIEGGLGMMGKTVNFPLEGGKVISARIVSPVFLDPEGSRQNV
ncbi:MAG: sarcosine oxidase subunit alpha family protein [Anderseniella sp.]